MLPHPTHDRLIALGLLGMAKAFEEQRQQPAVASLTFEERLGLLVDRETVERESRRLVTRLKFANIRQHATIEDLNTKAARGLDKALFAKLATGDWIGHRQDLLITGKTGTGKSWLACALGHKACRDDRSVLYYPRPRWPQPPIKASRKQSPRLPDTGHASHLARLQHQGAPAVNPTSYFPTTAL
jgi:DNA replication protein DnaC